MRLGRDGITRVVTVNAQTFEGNYSSGNANLCDCHVLDAYMDRDVNLVLSCWRTGDRRDGFVQRTGGDCCWGNYAFGRACQLRFDFAGS